MAERRTWKVTVDPEPGPEVTAVTDRDGDTWWRVPSGWHCGSERSAHLYGYKDGQPWDEVVIDFGPLVNATSGPTEWPVPTAPDGVLAVRNRAGLWVPLGDSGRWSNADYPDAAPTWAHLLADGPLTDATSEVEG